MKVKHIYLECLEWNLNSIHFVSIYTYLKPQVFPQRENSISLLNTFLTCPHMYKTKDACPDSTLRFFFLFFLLKFLPQFSPWILRTIFMDVRCKGACLSAPATLSDCRPQALASSPLRLHYQLPQLKGSFSVSKNSFLFWNCYTFHKF